MSDEVWYYADRERNNCGPLTAVAVAALFRKGVLNAQTLVWRENMSEWQPLSEFASEFGLAGNEMDPGFVMPLNPLPPAPPPASSRLDPARRATYPVYAGFWRRFAALIIDRLVIGLALGAVAVIVVLGTLSVGQAKAQSSAENAGAAAVQALIWLGYLVISPLYFALQESSEHQGTIGKRAMGIKVTTLDGERLSFGHALGRWLASGLSYFTFYIGFIMAGFTERKQALHDMIAGTLVVDRSAFNNTPVKQQSGNSGCMIAVVVGAVLAVLMAGILAAIAIPQYQDYVGRAQVSEGMAIASGLKTQVSNAYLQSGKCPTNADEGFRSAESYAGTYVASVTVGALDNGNCAVQIHYGGAKANRQIAGSTLLFEADRSAGDFRWTCRSDTLKNKFLPTICRSAAGGY